MMRRGARRAAEGLNAAARRGASTASVTPDGIRVDGIPSPLPTLFLHDNRPEWFDKQSRQRVSAAYGRAVVDPTPPEVAAARLTDDGKALEVEWRVQHPTKDDAPRSRYDLAWLKHAAAAAPAAADAKALADAPAFAVEEGVEPWSAGSFEGVDGTADVTALPGVDYTRAMTTDEGCLEWLETLHRYGFGILRNGPASKEDFDVALVAGKTANYVRESVYGGVWEFGVSEPLKAEDWDHADTAYGTDQLPLHTDGCYSYDPPGLQMLHCVEYEAVGGLSILADGAHVLQEFSKANPEAYALLTRYPFAFSYVDGDNGHYLRNTTPPVVLDAVTHRFKQLRLNDCDRDPFPPATPPEVYAAWNELYYHTNRPTTSVKFQLLPGSILVFDNWRCLHARSSFRGKRILKGCYMNREDFSSRLRVLRERVRGTPAEGLVPPPSQA